MQGTCFILIALQDFDRQVSPDTPSKTKARAYMCVLFQRVLVQKLKQLNLEQCQLLHDICCVWLWLRAKLETSFAQPVLQQHDLMFMKGRLG